MNTTDCTWLSYSTSPEPSICVLCAACELHTSWDGRRFQSRARVAADVSAASAAAYNYHRTLPPTFSHAMLQGSYSVALYGAPGRVDVAALRVAWLHLLPRAALHLVVQSGLCSTASMPPERPFHIGRDLSAALTVTFMSVPQGVAYAMIAGLPPAMD